MTSVPMRQYVVECRGDSREIYVVEAASEEEALRNWAQGSCLLTEAYGMEPISARLDDEKG